MTEQQRLWLSQHPDYEIIGAGGVSPTGQMLPATDRYRYTGALRADGTFATRTKPGPGEILVGIRKPMDAKDAPQQQMR